MRAFRKIAMLAGLAIIIPLSLTAREEEQIPKGHSFPVPPPKVQVISRVKEQAFSEDFETGGTGWTITNGVWEIGTPTYGPSSAHSGSKCAGTNLDGEYPNDASTRLVSSSITLPSLSPNSDIVLEFYHWFYLESTYDYGYVQVSTDGGSSWTTVGNSVNGSSSGWHFYSVDLTSYAGQNVKLAFLFTSDGSVTYAGWYIDDITITVQEPEPVDVTITSISSSLFPFIYLAATVDTFDYPIPSLTQSNFSVYENGALQTDYFEVTPPDIGGGVRIVDIVFCMDNSGSMSDEQYAVQQNVEAFVDSLVAQGINFALGLVRFGASQNSGYPIVEDNGQLTSDVNYFKNDVWFRNTIDGGFEPGYDALVAGATEFSFRSGANKILILITDEDVTYEGNSGSYTKEQCLSILRQNSGIVFALIDSSYYYSYTDYGTLAEETEGAWFDILEPMDEILSAISEMVGGTYIVRYRSSNQEPTGEREVIVRVNYLGESDEDTVYYIPGSAPIIKLTDETQDLLDSNLVAGSSISITAYITDKVEPYIQSATLYYRKTGTTSYSSVSMYNVSDSLYQGTIPGYSVETPGVDFYLTATDGISTTSIPASEPAEHPLQIAVLPNEKPVITHTPVTEVQEGQDIDIIAEVIDNTYYVDSVKLFYRRTGEIDYTETPMNNTFGDTYQGTIPGAIVTEDGVDYYIYAKDDLGVGAYHGRPETPHQTHIKTEFKVTRDGYYFGNRRYNMWPSECWTSPADSSFPTWKLYNAAFGRGWFYWKHIKKDKWTGSCFGFAISSLLFYEGHLSLENMGWTQANSVYKICDGYGRSSGNPIGNAGEEGDSVRFLVNKYFLYQKGKQYIDYKSEVWRISPDSARKVIQKSIEEGNRRHIALFDNGSGHSVVPYKIERENKKYKIYIYENRCPGDCSLYVEVDTVANTWKYEDLNWEGNSGLLPGPDISVFHAQPQLPFPYWMLPKKTVVSKNPGPLEHIQFLVDPILNVCITDEHNNKIGVNDSVIIDSMPDAIPLIMENGVCFTGVPYGYYLPTGSNYTATLTSHTEGTYDVSLFALDAMAALSEVSISSDGEDVLSFNPEGSIISFTTRDSKKSYCAEIGKPFADHEKIYEINEKDFAVSDTVSYELTTDNDLKIINKGLPREREYDLKIKYWADEPDSFIKTNLKIEGKETHIIKVSNWEILDSSRIWIEIDKGNDGTIDDTLFLQGGPPTGGMLDNKHVYAFRNPFNPNMEQTTIRFSLSKSAKVTLKITDVAGHLVSTLRNKVFMKKGSEHSVPWNGKNDKDDVVANGVYFYKITTDKGEEAYGKIAVVR